ncbi:MAG: hypothetical protein J5534_12710 [Fibrobacter sp.]|nr:hypothetical protein [Fibrobacter sp.]
MKFSATIPIIMIAAGLSFAQLLPQKPAETVKVDRAMIFKVDYEQGMAAPDSSSNRIDPSIKGSREKGDYLKNALIWNGLCVTGAALSAAFGGHGPIWCDPNSPARF